MQRPKGTKDIYGENQKLNTFVLNVLIELARLYNFEKIETPIFEHVNVFNRSIGETSDIVSKEMYQFQDKAGRELVLRPEGTAGVIRAIVENKLFANPLPLKLYYYGSMFRYENPQKGRQRQFKQFGIEIISDPSPYLDAEAILLAATILDTLKVSYQLDINSLGDFGTLKKWIEALQKYFEPFRDRLSPESQKRLAKNPLRILDDKLEQKKDFVQKAPPITQFYSPEAKMYFERLCDFLTTIGIKYQINHKLVRGLDYYTHTTFEFISKANAENAQGTIIGGGRYHNLLAEFGGPSLSGVGFGLGIERLLNDAHADLKTEIDPDYPEVYVLNIAEKTTPAALGIVYLLRRASIKTAWNFKPLTLRKAFAKAAKAKATINIICGPNEIATNEVIIKHAGHEKKITIEKIIPYVQKILGEKNK